MSLPKQLADKRPPDRQRRRCAHRPWLTEYGRPRPSRQGPRKTTHQPKHPVAQHGFLARLDPSAPLEAVKSGIERALPDLKRCARDVVKPLRNRPAMLRLESDGFQDQEIESPLGKLHSI